MRFATQIINFKKIGSKLWPWQCPRARIQNGRRDVIKYANELKMKRAQLDHCGTNVGKFGWNRPSSFAKRLVTDTHTHRQTDNPGIFGPRRSQYIQSMKMTECKNRKCGWNYLMCLFAWSEGLELLFQQLGSYKCATSGSGGHFKFSNFKPFWSEVKLQRYWWCISSWSEGQNL